MKKRRLPCLLCAGLAFALAAAAQAQKPHDALARARKKAKAENQRVLLFLRGGAPKAQATLAQGLTRRLGRLVRYEYQMVALPAESLAGKHLRQRFRVPRLPALVALDTADQRLGVYAPEAGEISIQQAEKFLTAHKCAPLDAREVLASGQAAAKGADKHLLVYLSAPW